MMNDPEPEFVVSDLDPERAPGMHLSRRALAFGTLACVVFLAGIGIAMLRAWQAHQGVVTATQIFPTAPPGTPVPTRVPPQGQGWVNAGPPIAQDIVFAPSAPQTAYSCGVVTPSEGAPQPVIVGTSHDGGATWHTQATSVADTGCHITVDPLDARDVVLVAGRCAGCPQPWLLRSRDGGSTWAVPTLPPHAGGPFALTMMQWAGDDLYIIPATRGAFSQGGGAHALAVSRAGGPFQWVEGNGLFAHAPSTAMIEDITGDRQTIYVLLTNPSGTNSPFFAELASKDSGSTWTKAPSFAVNDQSILLIDTSSTGQNLFGYIGFSPMQGHLVHSTDDGTTWQVLPALPADVNLVTYVGHTPDGTFYANLNFTDQTYGIFVLAPGSNAWQPAVSEPTGDILITISVDAAGHPHWLWGQAIDQDKILGHLQQHAP